MNRAALSGIIIMLCRMKKCRNTGLGVMLIAGIFHIPATLIGFIFAGGIAWLAKQLCLDSISGINRQAVDVFGYTAEIILLFLGVLLFTGPAM
mgnify:CR=1 FL=1